MLQSTLKKKIINMRKVVILSFLTSLLLGACGEDDYVYPNVLTDMIDLKTDHTAVSYTHLTLPTT